MTAATNPAGRGRVLAWAAWDWGAAAFNVIVTTFVFTVYLTSDGFLPRGLKEGTEAYRVAKAGLSTGLGAGLAIAGIAVALLAPVLGRRADLSGRRRRGLAIGTAVVVAVMLGMFGVLPTPSLFWLGVALVGVGTVAYEIASVNYNAMLLSVSTPRTIGRISAFGWAFGYLGGIIVLILLFLTVIPQGPQLLGIPGLADDALGVRICMVVGAVWTAVFGIPVLFAVPDVPGPGGERLGLGAIYRRLLADIAAIWRDDRNLFAFLIASAVFRDGLTGVFTFGAVIASTVFGFSFGEVILFGITANIVSGLATLSSGRFDDRFGPRRVILWSLVGLVAAAAGIFALHGLGQATFWIGGLLLCVFVGPAQASSRSMLGRLAPAERAGELFGLYATTGRAATFIAPAAFAGAIAIARDQSFGILGIVIVLLVGLALLLRVRDPAVTSPSSPARL